MVKDELKYELTVGVGRKVNLGNYENTDIEESLTVTGMNKKDLKDAHKTAEDFVNKEIERRTEEAVGMAKPDGDFHTPAPKDSDRISTDKEIETFLENAPEERITSGEEWPGAIPCYKCNVPANRTPNPKFDGTDTTVAPYEYKCENCTKEYNGRNYPTKSYPKFWMKKQGWGKK